MSEELKEMAKRERMEYFRDWRKKNKERVKKYNSEYWERRVTRKEATDKK